MMTTATHRLIYLIYITYLKGGKVVPINMFIINMGLLKSHSPFLKIFYLTTSFTLLNLSQENGVEEYDNDVLYPDDLSGPQVLPHWFTQSGINIKPH